MAVMKAVMMAVMKVDLKELRTVVKKVDDLAVMMEYPLVEKMVDMMVGMLAG